MSEQQILGSTLPHSSFGAPACCGCLNPVIHADHAEIICNECGVVVKTVPPTALQQILHQMELMLEVTSAKCPHCGAVHLSPGMSELVAFVCDECGEAAAPISDETPA